MGSGCGPHGADSLDSFDDCSSNPSDDCSPDPAGDSPPDPADDSPPNPADDFSPDPVDDFSNVSGDSLNFSDDSAPELLLRPRVRHGLRA